MKLRSKHILALIILLLGALFILVYIQSKRSSSGVSEEDFLAKIEKELAAGRATSTGPGTLPGLGQDPSLVPVIEIEPSDVYDMELVRNEGITFGEIRVHNRGKRELLINEVKTSCACTIGKMKNNTVAPGKYQICEVRLDPNRVVGFDTAKTLTFYSNDMKNLEVSIKVKARLEPEYIVDPQVLELGDVEKGEILTKKVLLRQLCDYPIEMKGTKLAKDSELINVEYKQRPEELWEKPGHLEYEITVALKDDLPVGELKQMYALQTTCKRAAAAMVWCTVKANIISFYKLTEAPKNRLILKRNGEASQVVTTVSSEIPIEIGDLSITSNDLLIEAKPVPESNSFEIIIGASSSATKAKREETVSFTIKSDDKQYTEKMSVNIWTK